MHRSWLRTKLSESGTKVTEKVAERAKSLVPLQRTSGDDTCMVCERPVRSHHLVRGDGRVCSPGCAKHWARGLT